jgi:hypothetical protein
LGFIGQNPCGPLAGNRDRDRRPCEGFSNASATRPVASARTASRHCRDADARLVVLVAQTSVCGFLIFAQVEWGRPMTDAHYARHRQRSAGLSRGCAIISRRLVHRAEFFFVFREAKRCTPMMSADRSKLSRRAALFLFVLIGVPSVVRSSTLEDSAKDLARKIAAALPAGENVSCEVRNISSLKPGEAARIEQALKAELQDLRIRLTSGEAAITVVVMLSENFKDLVWTGEIHQGDASQVVLIAVERSPENRAPSNGMPVTIRSEKFWEGPERILDAGEISDGAGKSWLVLLLPSGLLIQTKQTSSIRMMDIASAQIATRYPMGKLDFGETGNTVGFYLPPRVCTVDLEARNLTECLPTEGSSERPAPSRFPLMIDGAPAGPPPPGKGIELVIVPVCQGSEQFLATGAKDNTQADSLQLFEKASGGSVAVSSELDFPGPIVEMHSALGAPRIVLRNLTTGNYEAYRLSFSCGQ